MNVKDHNGNTPLMLAVGQGHMNTVFALLAMGADVNAVDDDGDTALIWAKSSGQKALEDVLSAVAGIE